MVELRKKTSLIFVALKEGIFCESLVAIGPAVSEEMLLTDGRTDGGRQTPDDAPSHKLRWPLASRAKNHYYMNGFLGVNK